MKHALRQPVRALALGAVILGMAGSAAAVDPGVAVWEPGRGITRGVGVGAPSAGVVDPGLNQPGVPGNVCGVARCSIPTLRASLLSHSLKDLS